MSNLYLLHTILYLGDVLVSYCSTLVKYTSAAEHSVCHSRHSDGDGRVLRQAVAPVVQLECFWDIGATTLERKNHTEGEDVLVSYCSTLVKYTRVLLICHYSAKATDPPAQANEAEVPARAGALPARLGGPAPSLAAEARARS